MGFAAYSSTVAPEEKCILQNRIMPVLGGIRGQRSSLFLYQSYTLFNFLLILILSKYQFFFFYLICYNIKFGNFFSLPFLPWNRPQKLKTEKLNQICLFQTVNLMPQEPLNKMFLKQVKLFKTNWYKFEWSCSACENDLRIDTKHTYVSRNFFIHSGSTHPMWGCCHHRNH